MSVVCLLSCLLLITFIVSSFLFAFCCVHCPFFIRFLSVVFIVYFPFCLFVVTFLPCLCFWLFSTLFIVYLLFTFYVHCLLPSPFITFIVYKFFFFFLLPSLFCLLHPTFTVCLQFLVFIRSSTVILPFVYILCFYLSFYLMPSCIRILLHVLITEAWTKYRYTRVLPSSSPSFFSFLQAFFFPSSFSFIALLSLPHPPAPPVFFFFLFFMYNHHHHHQPPLPLSSPPPPPTCF